MRQIKPSKKGQIVRIYNTLPGENSTIDYLLADDPIGFEDNFKVLIYPISEIQRTQQNGGIPFGDMIPIGDLTVIGESLEDWVKSWNAQV